MTENNSNVKIMKVLKKMDEIFLKNGYSNHQERIHRIYKALLSIERHGECFVSSFCLEDIKKDYNDSTHILSDSFSSNYLSVVTENKIEIENYDKQVTKLDIDDLLDFIEDELNIKSLISIEDSTLSSSSSEEEKFEFQENQMFKKRNKKILNKTNMQKKFFNIELRLRAYLKEDTLFKKGFDSFLNESKLKTPLSKVSPCKITLPAIVKNFFEDRLIVEAAKKRYSVKDDFRNQLSRLGNTEEIMKCKSNFERIPFKNQTTPNSSDVSNFSIDIGHDNSNDSTGNTYNASNSKLKCKKRDSIFKERYIDFIIVEEDKNLNESISDISEKTSSNEEEEN